MTKRFAVGVLVACAMLGVPALAAGPLHHGDAAPAFTLPRLSGGTLAFSSLRGKPVYLSFFATWCAPCNDEAPSIVSLENKYRSRGLVVLGVDEQESVAKTKTFTSKYHIPFKVVIDDGPMGKDYGVLALPVHVFVGRNGKIDTYRLGEMSPSEIEAAIKKIL
jgi:cytochrome c biogenesis protein CcmG/thiol:disulfide interchange protein DsbE